MVFTTISTLLHYTHNFVEIDQYPPSFVPDVVTQVLVLVSWPAFTALGIVGYQLCRDGRYSKAHACLVTYSFVGWLTLGHFTSGNPDIAPFFYATILTDAIAAAAITGWVLWSTRTLASARTARASH